MRHLDAVEPGQARAARGGSKSRATSSRQPVSFVQERSVTLRVGSRASSPGSEWRPERSQVESTTTRVANGQQALDQRLPALGIEAQQQEHRQVGQQQARDQARQRRAVARRRPGVTSSQRSSAPPPLGEAVVTTSALASTLRSPRSCQRDDRPRRAVAGQLLEQPRHARRPRADRRRAPRGRAAACAPRPRSPPRSSARRSSTLGDRAHGRRHLRPSRASSSSAASGPQPPAA